MKVKLGKFRKVMVGWVRFGFVTLGLGYVGLGCVRLQWFG